MLLAILPYEWKISWGLGEVMDEGYESVLQANLLTGLKDGSLVPRYVGRQVPFYRCL